MFNESLIVLIALCVYFAGHAWLLLGSAPDTVRVVTGVSAAFLAVSVLLQLV